MSGPTGLEAITELLETAPRWLATHGVFVCEIAPHQAGEAAALARRAGFAEVVVHDDLNRRPAPLSARAAQPSATAS